MLPLRVDKMEKMRGARNKHALGSVGIPLTKVVSPPEVDGVIVT
jgi:hypothetical protein